MNPATQPPVVEGNYFDKYQTKNPVYQWLINRFLQQARVLLQRAAPRRVLEVGCADGTFAQRLFYSGQWPGEIPEYTGVDISEEQIRMARDRYPGQRFQVASIYQLPFADQSFDCIIACEVFEHLKDPVRGLAEVHQVARDQLLASVPHEPWWRIFNLLRGKYLTAWGNTPGHLQHFSPSAFRALISRDFVGQRLAHPLPWIMILAARRPSQP